MTRQVRHRDHVAVRVVGVGFGERLPAADRCAAQSIAVLGWFDQARLVVRVAPGPVAIRRLVKQSQEIADRVVLVPFGVAAHGLPIVRGAASAHGIGRPRWFAAGRLARCARALAQRSGDSWRRRYSRCRALRPDC